MQGMQSPPMPEPSQTTTQRNGHKMINRKDMESPMYTTRPFVLELERFIRSLALERISVGNAWSKADAWFLFFCLLRWRYSQQKNGKQRNGKTENRKTEKNLFRPHLERWCGWLVPAYYVVVFKRYRWMAVFEDLLAELVRGALWSDDFVSWRTLGEKFGAGWSWRLQVDFQRVRSSLIPANHSIIFKLYRRIAVVIRVFAKMGRCALDREDLVASRVVGEIGCSLTCPSL